MICDWSPKIAYWVTSLSLTFHKILPASNCIPLSIFFDSCFYIMIFLWQDFYFNDVYFDRHQLHQPCLLRLSTEKNCHLNWRRNILKKRSRNTLKKNHQVIKLMLFLIGYYSVLNWKDFWLAVTFLNWNNFWLAVTMVTEFQTESLSDWLNITEFQTEERSDWLLQSFFFVH